MPLKLHKRNNSPYWQITGTHLGVRVRESTGTASREVAQKLCTKKQREIEAGYTLNRTFADAILAYIENNGETRFLARINDVMGDIPLQEVNQEVIDRKAREAYGTYTKTPGGKQYKHSTATVKRQFYDPVAAVLHYAAELEWIPYKRVKKPKTTLPPPEWAEPEWFTKYWNVCEPEMRALTMFLVFTGARIRECLDLKWSDVDLNKRKAFMLNVKVKGEYRTVNLPTMLNEELKKIYSEESEMVFNYTYDNVVWRLKKGCKEAGIKYMSTHKIGSHSYATWMRRQGADTRDLIDTGRWKSPQMANRYTHTDTSEASRKSDKFEDLF